MKRIQSAGVAMIAGLGALFCAPVAHAEETVTYEISSNSVGVLPFLQYRDTSGKHLLRDVPLPWTLTVPVVDARSPTADGAELRADWRPILQGQFVTVRITKGGDVLCESMLDLGNAACYGSVPHTAINESSPGNLP